MAKNLLDGFMADLASHASGLQGDARRAYDDLEYYSEYVMGWQNPDWQGNSPFLKRVYQALQEDDDDVMILGPRGSAKSTATSVTYVTWDIGRNPMIRYLLAFNSLEQQGMAFVRQIKHVITENERYREIFGDLYPGRGERWTDTEFIVRRPTPPGGMKDPTVVAVGIGSAVPSKRADKVILDDLVTKDNAYTEAMRAKVVAFVVQTLFPILVPGGRRIVVGSRWDPDDLYAYLARQWRLKFPKAEAISASETLLPYVQSAVMGGAIGTDDDFQQEEWSQDLEDTILDGVAG